MKPLTILISSAGRRVELINCFRQSARDAGVKLRVIGVDREPSMSAACQVADFCFAVPPVNSELYISSLRGICEREGVAIVVPTIDSELAVLSKSRTAFKGCDILVSNEDAIAISDSKFLTYQRLNEVGVDVPMTYRFDSRSRIEPEWEFPLILKPEHGSRSIGIFHAENAVELSSVRVDLSGYVAQQKVAGREFTCNCYVSRSGNLIAAVPHERVEVRSGEVSKARTSQDERMNQIAQKILEAVPGLSGPFCFQYILDQKGTPWVFEINARFGGGYPLSHYAGAEFSRWIIEEHLGKALPEKPHWRSGVTMLRYDAAVFYDAGEM